MHQFQGSERDYILFDATETYGGRYLSTLLNSFDNNISNRLMNVALSRTKMQFILLSNNHYLFSKKLKDNLLKNLLVLSENPEFVKAGFSQRLEREQVLELMQFCQSHLSGEKEPESLGWHFYSQLEEPAFEKYLHALKKAKKEVRIDAPAWNVPAGQRGRLRDALLQIAKRVRLIIRCNDKNDLPECLRSYAVAGYFLEAGTMIDQKRFWLNIPSAGLPAFGKEKKKEWQSVDLFPVVRIDSAKTTLEAGQVFDLFTLNDRNLNISFLCGCLTTPLPLTPISAARPAVFAEAR